MFSGKWSGRRSRRGVDEVFIFSGYCGISLIRVSLGEIVSLGSGFFCRLLGCCFVVSVFGWGGGGRRCLFLNGIL